MYTAHSETFDLESEGLKLRVFYARPKEDGKYPLLLINHGGGGMEYIFELLCFHAVAVGFVGVAMTFRGYPPSQGKQEYGGGEIKDLSNLIDFFKEKSFVDSKNIGVFGYSRGGHHGLLLAEKRDDIKALAIWSAPVDLFDLYRLHPELLEYTVGGNPFEKPDLYKERSPIFHVHKLRCSVLIIHGEYDEVVPIEHAYRLIQKLEKMGKDYEALVAKGEGHSFSQQGFEAAWQHTLKFFVKKFSS